MRVDNSCMIALLHLLRPYSSVMHATAAVICLLTILLLMLLLLFLLLLSLLSANMDASVRSNGGRFGG